MCRPAGSRAPARVRVGEGHRRLLLPPLPPLPGPQRAEVRIPGEDALKHQPPRATQTPAESAPATTVITIVTNTYYLLKPHNTPVVLLLPFYRCGN